MLIIRIRIKTNVVYRYMQVAFQAQQLVSREKLISPQKKTNHTQQQEVKRRKTALVNRENGNKYETQSSQSRACPSLAAMPVQKYIHPRRKDEPSLAGLQQSCTK